MNDERCYSGIYVDNIGYNRVYIGGGWDLPKKFEYFDINENEWISLCDTNGSHQYWPCIWSDNNNPNLINIASVYKSKYIEQIDIRENKWNEYKINNHESIDTLFGTIMDKNDMYFYIVSTGFFFFLRFVVFCC